MARERSYTFEEWHQEALADYRATGFPEALAQACAKRDVERNWKKHEGTRVLFKVRCNKGSRRELEIFNAFNGTNHAELAKRHDVSIRTVERIIARHHHQRGILEKGSQLFNCEEKTEGSR